MAAAALVVYACAWVLLVLGIEPVPTWFYVFAWYPTLLALDRGAARRGRRTPLLADGRLALSLLAWSALIWLLFEAANFRLQNWYYVFLPRRDVERWAGIVLSFATVVPALVLAERLLDAVGIGSSWAGTRMQVRGWELRAAVVAGVATAALALASPRVFFPLIWGAAWPVADALVYRRRPAWSLIADLEQGRWGRIGRLLIGGLIIGLLWEGYNFWARGRWIYTVPWLEQVKLFEMPPVGFLGFPVFALEAWALYHLLCVAGVAVPPDRSTTPKPGRTAVAGVAAAAVAVAILLGMERHTISSTVPRLQDLPGVEPAHVAALAATGIELSFALAAVSPDYVAARTPLAHDEAAAVVEAARLATLRGLGAGHAATLRSLGILTVCDLARADPGVVYRHATADGSVRPTAAEARVWRAAARRACR